MAIDKTPIPAYGITHPGASRKENEDHFLIDKSLSLYIVSDGVTHPSGAKCSQEVCESIRGYIRDNKKIIEANEKNTTSASRQSVLTLIKQAIELTSHDIYLATRLESEMKGVIATVCVVLISRGFAFIGHLGDSRAYSIRDGSFYLLTRDHTYLANLLAQGLTLEKAQKVKYSNNLSAAMGYEPVAIPDLQARELAQGERILLCTDGLSDLFTEQHFRSPEWAKLPSEKLPAALQDFALKKAARDNLTALLVDCTAQSAPPSNQVSVTVPKINTAQVIPDVLEKINAIREIRLFQHFGERSLMKILNLADTRELDVGEKLIERGRILNEMYIVLSGELSIDLGKGPISATVKKGEVVGEMSLFDGSLPSATLAGLQKTLVLSLTREHLFKAMKEDVEFAARFELGVLQAVIQRLRERTEPDEAIKTLKNYTVVSILPPESS